MKTNIEPMLENEKDAFDICQRLIREIVKREMISPTLGKFFEGLSKINLYIDRVELYSETRDISRCSKNLLKLNAELKSLEGSFGKIEEYTNLIQIVREKCWNIEETFSERLYVGGRL